MEPRASSNGTIRLPFRYLLKQTLSQKTFRIEGLFRSLIAMPPHLPNTQNTLSEPKPYNRDASDEDNHDSNSLQVRQDRTWLREQLLAGKNSPLCDPLTPEYFQRLRALARGEL
jgi:hypothetical protein